MKVGPRMTTPELQRDSRITTARTCLLDSKTIESDNRPKTTPGRTAAIITYLAREYLSWNEKKKFRWSLKLSPGLFEGIEVQKYITVASVSGIFDVNRKGDQSPPRLSQIFTISYKT